MIETKADKDIDAREDKQCRRELPFYCMETTANSCTAHRVYHFEHCQIGHDHLSRWIAALQARIHRGRVIDVVNG